MRLDPNFDWKTYAWIKRGSRRIKVLQYMANTKTPITATLLKKTQGIDITQAAFTLSELWKKNLVKCLNSGDHHGKLFILSSKSKKIVNKITL